MNPQKEKKKKKAAAEDMKQTKTVSKETKTRQESEQVELAQKESRAEKKQVAPKQKKEDKAVAKPAEVRKEKKVSKKAGSKFTVQIMETDDYEKALVEASKLTIKDIKNRIDKRKQAGKTYYSIKSGEFYDYQDARKYLDSIKSKISYDDLLIYKIK